MRTSFLYFMVLILVGIGVMIVSTASAAEFVTFDGKQLFFPKSERIEPEDISGLKFTLQLPDDKRFLEGKVYRAQPVYPRGTPGPTRYVLFTKWTPKEIEIFWWPTNFTLKNESFLDCSAPAHNNNEFKCRGVRGSKIKAGILFRFVKDKIRILIDDGADADLELAGEIPMQFINEHKETN